MTSAKQKQKLKIYGARDDKLKASKALLYEWRMLNECAIRISSFENKDRVIHDALIEACCVHLRNFIEFFYRKPKKGKRPFWKDYLSSNKIISLKYKLDKYEDKVNNLLSHLTYERLNYTKTKKEWPINQIAKEINENMFQFIEAADKNLLCNEIKIYKKKLDSGNPINHIQSFCTTSNAVAQSQLVSKTKDIG